MKGTPGPANAAIFWLIWFSILSGLLIIQFFAAGGLPSGVDQGQAPVMFQGLALGMGAVAMAVRFVVIPKIATLERKLPAMIIGLAIAEAVGILGAFVVDSEFGATRMFMLATSIVCIVVSAPIYAKSPDAGNSFRS